MQEPASTIIHLEDCLANKIFELIVLTKLSHCAWMHMQNVTNIIIGEQIGLMYDKMWLPELTSASDTQRSEQPLGHWTEHTR